MIEQRIEAQLEGLFKEEAFEDCFLIEIKFNAPQQKLEVFIDSDSGIDFDRCREISRKLESEIEENGWLGEKYTLEVSSPGVDRPLKLPRQFPKHIGRKLELKLQDGSSEEGTLTEVGEDSIILERKVRIKEGKRKKTITENPEIAYSDIEEAKVKISFK